MSENPPAQSPPGRTAAGLVAGVVALSLLAAVALGFWIGDDGGDDGDTAAAAAATSAEHGVITAGTGSVTATPDQLQFSVHVSRQAAEADDALAAASAMVRRVTSALKDEGIAAKDIRTTAVSVSPTYRYVNGESIRTGYRSSQSMRVLVRELDQAGTALGAATDAGGDAVRVGSVSLTVGDTSGLQERARQKALAESRQRAAQLAEAAGRELGEAVFITESGGDLALQELSYSMRRSALAGLAKTADSAAKVPIAPGRRQVKVSVEVRWSLN